MKIKYYGLSMKQRRIAFLISLANQAEYVLGDEGNYRGLKLCQMNVDEEGNIHSTRDEIYAGPAFFNPYWNTRYIQPTECHFDFDGETAEEGIKAAYDTAAELDKLKIHYFVFYAKGMRSPHIVIYDLLPEEGLSERQRTKARECFAHLVVPLQHQLILDKALFGNHKCPLEFAKHWKYKKYFRLLWEGNPPKTGNSTQAYYDSKGVDAEPLW